MRKFIVFGLVAVATAVFASNSATAVSLVAAATIVVVAITGGGNNNGKNSNKYCIYVKNKDHYKVWPVGFMNSGSATTLNAWSTCEAKWSTSILTRLAIRTS